MNYYLYGLQRSGTNVVQTFIEKNYNISFMNGEKRYSPSHKHFRIYDNKNLIPVTDKSKQYNNPFIINSLEDLDKLLRDLNHTNRYIIVYKDIFSWLPSIEKWAKECKWITNSKMDFIEDYLHFIKKWYSIRNDRVIFINYYDYLNLSDKDNSLLDRLSLFLNYKPQQTNSTFDRVNCSSKFTSDRKKYYLNKEYLNIYSKEEIDKIKNNPTYKEITEYEF